jgi:hypothetical protein
MDSLTISDPAKLRVPFGGGCKNMKKQSWMTVAMPAGFTVEVDRSSDSCADDNSSSSNAQHAHCNSWDSIPHSTPQHGMQDIVMDISRQSNIKMSMEPLMHSNQAQIFSGRNVLEHRLEIKGWVLSVGHAIFALSLALCNLTSVANVSQVCAVMSPLPMVCLFFQAVFCMDQNQSSGAHGRNYSRLTAWCLVFSVLVIPTVCVSWNVHLSTAFCVCLSVSTVLCQRQRGPLVWVCITGLFVSLVVTNPAAAVNLIEPRWGMTLAAFFLGVLCFLACMSQSTMELKIRYI